MLLDQAARGNNVHDGPAKSRKSVLVVVAVVGGCIVCFVLGLKLLEALLIYSTAAFSFRGDWFSAISIDQIAALVGFLSCQILMGALIASGIHTTASKLSAKLYLILIYSVCFLILSLLCIRPFLRMEQQFLRSPYQSNMALETPKGRVVPGFHHS